MQHPLVSFQYVSLPVLLLVLGAGECSAAELITRPGTGVLDISDDGSRVLWLNRQSDLNEITDTQASEVWTVPLEGSDVSIGSSGTQALGALDNEPAIWHLDGEVRLLGTGGYVWGHTFGLSSDGEFATGSLSSTHLLDEGSRGFLWNSSQDIVPLPPTAGFAGSSAFDISADGRVVAGQSFKGRTGVPFFESEATIWRNDGVGNFETIGLGRPDNENTFVHLVSDDGSAAAGSIGIGP